MSLTTRFHIKQLNLTINSLDDKNKLKERSKLSKTYYKTGKTKFDFDKRHQMCKESSFLYSKQKKDIPRK